MIKLWSKLLTFCVFTLALVILDYRKHINEGSSWIVSRNRRRKSSLREVSKYGVVSGPYFPVFGLSTGKYRPEIWTLFTQYVCSSKSQRQLCHILIGASSRRVTSLACYA